MVTIFSEFAKRKLQGFQKPERRGIQKGDRIGLSEPTFRSLIYSLTGASVKEIADRAGLGYDVLKSLRWKEDYKKALRDLEKGLCIEFVDALVDFLLDSVVHDEEGEYAGIQEDPDLNLFADVSILSEKVFHGVLAEIARRSIPDRAAEDCLLRDILPMIMDLRKGNLTISDSGGFVVINRALIVTEESDSLVIRLEWQDFFSQRPDQGTVGWLVSLMLKSAGSWDAPRAVIGAELARFFKTVEAVR